MTYFTNAKDIREKYCKSRGILYKPGSFITAMMSPIGYEGDDVVPPQVFSVHIPMGKGFRKLFGYSDEIQSGFLYYKAVPLTAESSSPEFREVLETADLNCQLMLCKKEVIILEETLGRNIPIKKPPRL